MTPTEYAAWLAQAVLAYAEDKVASGQWNELDSVELSQKEHETLLPEGLESKGNHLFSVVAPTGETVGALWFAEKLKFGLPIAYVYNVVIEPRHRRRGFATRAFQALEGEVTAMGLHGVALHVFGSNHGAQKLYANLGYEPTNINLFKHLRS